MILPLKRFASWLPTGKKVRSCSTWSSLICTGMRDIADLVEEDDAVGGAAAEEPFVVVHCAGEGALPVAEQLRFQQPLRNTGRG